MFTDQIGKYFKRVTEIHNFIKHNIVALCSPVVRMKHIKYRTHGKIGEMYSMGGPKMIKKLESCKSIQMICHALCFLVAQKFNPKWGVNNHFTLNLMDCTDISVLF